MITPQYASTMARYNCWQNESIYSAADQLSNAERKQNRGAFFSSIHGTLSHLLWGDQIWLQRFGLGDGPSVSSISESASMIEIWGELKRVRFELDSQILEWAEGLQQSFFEEDMSWYSGSQKRDIVCNVGTLVMHMFNHQTHHRGQVHAMLTVAGCKPDDTDLFLVK